MKPHKRRVCTLRGNKLNFVLDIGMGGVGPLSGSNRDPSCGRHSPFFFLLPFPYTSIGNQPPTGCSVDILISELNPVEREMGKGGFFPHVNSSTVFILEINERM